MLRLLCDYLGMKFAGEILTKTCERAELKKDQKALRKALGFGMSLYFCQQKSDSPILPPETFAFQIFRNDAYYDRKARIRLTLSQRIIQSEINPILHNIV
jgi:hypothetical protein